MEQAGQVITKLKSVRTEYQTSYQFNSGQQTVPDQLWRVTEQGVLKLTTEKKIPLPEENQKKRLVNRQWWPVNHLPPLDWTDQQDYWQKLKEGII